ncbi:hypothetical protein CLOM_g16818 [Closterium sp. NIES-68]|nr:hypothetical protein CLOM_g16818 [Closterium sp. NIES-68]GJP75614.1 hypothetical protein CLOP_g6043 [Closterium sp. NIES-67]
MPWEGSPARSHSSSAAAAACAGECTHRREFTVIGGGYHGDECKPSGKESLLTPNRHHGDHAKNTAPGSAPSAAHQQPANGAATRGAAINVDNLGNGIAAFQEKLASISSPFFGGASSAANPGGGGSGGGAGSASSPPSLASHLGSHAMVLLMAIVSLLMSAICLALVLSLPTQQPPQLAEQLQAENGSSSPAFQPHDLSQPGAPSLNGSRREIIAERHDDYRIRNHDAMSSGMTTGGSDHRGGDDVPAAAPGNADAARLVSSSPVTSDAAAIVGIPSSSSSSSRSSRSSGDSLRGGGGTGGGSGGGGSDDADGDSSSANSGGDGDRSRPNAGDGGGSYPVEASASAVATATAMLMAPAAAPKFLEPAAAPLSGIAVVARLEQTEAAGGEAGEVGEVGEDGKGTAAVARLEQGDPDAAGEVGVGGKGTAAVAAGTGVRGAGGMMRGATAGGATEIATETETASETQTVTETETETETEPAMEAPTTATAGLPPVDALIDTGAQTVAADSADSWDGVQAIVHITTSVLPLALQRLCQASALAALHNVTVGALWDVRPHSSTPASTSSSSGGSGAANDPPLVPFSALLTPPKGVVVRTSLPAGMVVAAGGRRIRVERRGGAENGGEDFGIASVKGRCWEKENEPWSPLLLPMAVYVPRHLGRAMAATSPCGVYEETMTCYQSLQPAAAVQAMVEGEDVGRARKTIGVLLEDPKHTGTTPPPPCASASKHLPTCLTRNLTTLFLYNPSLDFTLAAASPPLPALSVSSAFHPNRAPLLPSVALWRAKHCREDDMEGSARVAVACSQRLLAELFLLSDAPSLIYTHKSPAFAFIVARGSTRQSRGLARAFDVVQPSLCTAGCPKPLLENKFAKHMIVDESLNALYCALPKVGNTSWKLWFRLMKLRGNFSAFHSFGKGGTGDGAAAAGAGGGTGAEPAGEAAKKTETAAPAPAAAAAAEGPAALNITTEDFKMIHQRGFNGITELPQLTEEGAIRFITRRDVFRFTFVRNPLTRATSAYLDKFVHARNFTNEGDPRLYWADAMFGNTTRLGAVLERHPSGNFSFAEFLALVEEALKGDADAVENHIDKQIGLCGLDRVHYDFVGRFESMSADVGAVMRQLNTSDLGIFQKGKSLQLTGADQKSAQLYDKALLERAKRIYRDDMRIPFNAIRYGIPEALKQYASQATTAVR